MLSLQDDDDTDRGDDNDMTMITTEHEHDAGDEHANEGGIRITVNTCSRNTAN